MCYTTLVQPKSLPTKLFNATLIQPDFFKLFENNFRGLHLHNLESLRYHFTLHSHDLTFTTSAQFTFRVLHLHNLKSLSKIRFCTLHSPTWLSLHLFNLITGLYTCTTWNLFLYGKMTYFTLHWHTLIFVTIAITWFSWLFHSCCLCMFCETGKIILLTFR